MINYNYPTRKCARIRQEHIEEGIIELFNKNPYKYLNRNRLSRDTTHHHKTITLILHRVCSEGRLKHFYDGFEIPYIQLPPTMKINQVADIFENINTKGKPLNSFDLLIARLLKYGIKLRDLWDDAKVKYPNLDRYFSRSEKLRIYIFQAISLYYHKSSSCKSGDILNIYENIYKKNTEYSFIEHWNEFIGYIDKAIQKLENLRDGFGVKSEKDVPFISVIPILAALLKEVDSQENKMDCNKKINMWYWSVVFTNYFSSAVDSKLTSDFKELRDWFSDDTKVPKSIEQARINWQLMRLKGIDAQSNAMYRGVMSLLALQGSKDFETGEMLENAPTNQKDHLFPRGRKKEIGSKYIDSVLNMAWLSNKTNIRKSDKRPSQYIKDFIDVKCNGNEDTFLSILKTHFITKEVYQCMNRDDFEGFLNLREKVIISKIMELIGAKSDIEIQFDESELDVINKFENRLRAFIDANMREKSGEDWWKTIPDNIKKAVTEKLEQEKRNNPTFNAEEYKQGINLLKKTDLEHLRQIVTSQWKNVFGDLFKATPEEFTFHFRNILNLRNKPFHSNEPESDTKNLGLGSLERMNKVLKFI